MESGTVQIPAGLERAVVVMLSPTRLPTLALSDTGTRRTRAGPPEGLTGGHREPDESGRRREKRIKVKDKQRYHEPL